MTTDMLSPAAVTEIAAEIRRLLDIRSDHSQTRARFRGIHALQTMLRDDFAQRNGWIVGPAFHPGQLGRRSNMPVREEGPNRWPVYTLGCEAFMREPHGELLPAAIVIQPHLRTAADLSAYCSRWNVQCREVHDHPGWRSPGSLPLLVLGPMAHV